MKIDTYNFNPERALDRLEDLYRALEILPEDDERVLIFQNEIAELENALRIYG